MNNLRDILYHYYPISAESATEFSEILIRKKYKNKTELSNNDKFYVLIDGFVRSYTIHDNGSIRIGAFLSKSSIFTSIKPLSILSNVAIQEVKFDCLSDVILYEGSFSKFKKNNDGLLSWGKAVKIGVGIVLIGTLISIVYNQIFSNFIEPDFYAQVAEIQKQGLLDYGATEEQADAQIEMQSKFQGTLIGDALGLLFFAFVGFVISAIAGAVMKHTEEDNY